MEKSKKKILFIGRFPKPMHGAAKMNELYYESKLINQAFNVRKIKINTFEDLDQMGKYTISKLLGFFKVFFQLLFSLIFFRPNIIYFELAATGVAFYRDSIYALVCKLFRRKLFFTFHSKGISDKLNNRLIKIYYSFILHKSHVIQLSPSLYYDIQKLVPKKRVSFIGNGILDELNSASFKKIIKKREKSSRVNLLYLSNMIESKGPLDVLNICKLLKDHKIKFKCSFVGGFPDEEFKKRFNHSINDLSLSDECKVLGPLYGSKKLKVLEDTNFLIFPTTYPIECYPLVILEAFMFGIYVLSYDNAAIKDIIFDKRLGTVAKANDYTSLANTLVSKIKNLPDSSYIRDIFIKQYTFKTSEKKLLRLFNEKEI